MSDDDDDSSSSPSSSSPPTYESESEPEESEESESEDDEGPRDESTPRTVAECLYAIFGTSGGTAGGEDDESSPSWFASCTSSTEEFAVVKKAYFKRVLRHHPDKGGDPSTFRRIQTSFEVVRELYSSGRIAAFSDEVASSRKRGRRTGGGTSTGGTAAEGYEETYADFENVPTPSWAYYAEAAGETVPTYRVELAKSGRSKCSQKGAARKCTADISEPSLIPRGDVRVGWLDDGSGSYGRWVHLPCWRVPSMVWMGLPDPESDDCRGLSPEELYHRFEVALRGMNEVLLCGVGDLPDEERRELVEHCMDKSNWARLVKRRDDGGEGEGGGRRSKVPEKRVNARTGKLEVSSSAGGVVAKRKKKAAGGRATSKAKEGKMSSSAVAIEAPTTTANGVTSSALVAKPKPPGKKEAFVVPRPGVDGCPRDALAGKTIVLTGIFPELGGGTGLNLGKDRVKSMIQSFGGRVTSALSGKTDILLVGRDPGFGKVSKARGMANVTMMSLRDVRGLMEGRGADAIEEAKREPMVIESFSAGYSYARGGPNSLALGASRSALAIAAGTAPARLDSKPTAPSEVKREAVAGVAAKKVKAVAKKKKSGPKKRTPAATTAASKKSRKKARAATPKEEEEVMEIITCDSCGTDCTSSSWFVEGTGEDFCGSCYHAVGAGGGGGGRCDGVPQVNGVPAARAPTFAIESS